MNEWVGVPPWDTGEGMWNYSVADIGEMGPIRNHLSGMHELATVNRMEGRENGGFHVHGACTLRLLTVGVDYNIWRHRARYVSFFCLGRHFEFSIKYPLLNRFAVSRNAHDT